MPYVIRGSLKDYDWGVIDGLVPWLGQATGGPQAELWFGAHAAGPAPLVLDDQESRLQGNAEAAPAGAHLAQVAKAEDVPLLVKILAADRPLSVQVHPNADLAARVFAGQSAPGALQVYADPFEKTELLLALTPFTAFCGWRSQDDAESILRSVVGAGEAVDALHSGDRRASLRALLAIRDLDAALASLPLAMFTHPDRATFARVSDAFPGDRGVLLLVLLAVETLAPGDAVFVPAGVPHSYVHGIGVEVMTSSDNVVRLGLTSKPVHVEQALAALSDTEVPTVIRGAESWIQPPGGPFALCTIEGNASVPAAAGRYRLVLSLSGDAMVDVCSVQWTLPAGQALVVLADEPVVTVRSTGKAVLVSDVPANAVPEGERQR